MKRWWPFAVLCVAASCVWMLMDAWPGVRLTMGSEAYGCLAAAVIAVGVAVRKPRGEGLWMAGVGGAMVLAGPEVGSFVGARVDAGGIAIALALTAVVVGVVEGAMGMGELDGERLWPGMVACTGLLLALSAPGLGDWRADLAMGLAPVMVGVGAVLFRRSGVSVEWKVAAGLLGGAVVFGLGTAATRGWGEISGVGVVVEMVLLGLAMVVLGKVSAMQYAGRYAVVPLLTLLQGVVLLHSMVTWRVGVCGVMLGVAGWGMLRGRCDGWGSDDSGRST